MNQLGGILEKVTERTIDGLLEWQVAEAGRSYELQIENLTLRVALVEDWVEYHKLEVIHESGELICDLRGDEEKEYANQVKSLFDLARRAALNVDDNLARLDRALNPPKTDSGE